MGEERIEYWVRIDLERLSNDALLWVASEFGIPYAWLDYLRTGEPATRVFSILVLARAFLEDYHADARKGLYDPLDIGVPGVWIPWLLFCGSYQLIEQQAEGGRIGVFFLPRVGLGSAKCLAPRRRTSCYSCP